MNRYAGCLASAFSIALILLLLAFLVQAWDNVSPTHVPNRIDRMVSE